MPQLAIVAAASWASSAVVAAGYGAFAGAVAAGAVSYGLSALFAPTQKSYGPRLADLKTPQVAYGSVIPYVQAHPRLAGAIVYASEKRELSSTVSQGKGGGGSEVTTYSYEQDVMYLLAENETAALRRVWRNGELLWSKADDTDDGSRTASDEAALWTRITFYGGGPDQLPDPTYEAAVGVGNAPAYRTRTMVFIEGLQLGTSGQLPNLTFEIATEIEAISVATPPQLELLFDDLAATDTSSYGAVPSVGASVVFSDAGADHGYMLFDSANGTDNKIYVAGAQLNKPDGVLMTIEFWVTWMSLAFVTNNGLFRIMSPTKTTSIGFYLNGGRLGWNASAGDELLTASPVVNLGVRTKIAFTIDASGYGRLYVNDVLVLAQQVSASEFTATTLEIGTTVSDVFYTYEYRIDDFRVWFGELVVPGLISLAEPTLQEVVERQCVRAGLDLAYVDASALATRTVRSMVISQLTSPRQVLEMLATAYLFTQVESDVLRFSFRGGAAVASIDYDELVTTGDESPLPVLKANDLELLVQAFVRYSNVLDDYQDGSESSDRLVSSGQNTTQVELPVGLTPTEAKRIADSQVMDAAAGALRVGPFSLTRDHAALEPTDVITVADADGNLLRVRLTRKTEAGGVLTFEAVSDDAPVLASQAETSTDDYVYSFTVRPPVETDYDLMDIPLLDDADDEAGFYAVAKPAVDVSFPGAMLFKSADNVTFEAVGSTTREGTFGTALTVLTDGPVGVFDEQHSLTVDVGFGELSSVTRDALLASGSTNLLRLGAELLQFRTATLVSPGVYTLTSLLRGRRGTEWAVPGHLYLTDEPVALLDTAVRRVPSSNGELGLLRYWKAVTMGHSAAGVDSEEFTNNGVSQKPFAPVDIRFARDPDSGDITITAKRRTRRFTRMVGPLGISVPLGEESEEYELEIMNGVLVWRLFISDEPSFTYTAAQQIEDWGSLRGTLAVRMYQMSATIRRGYVAEASWIDGSADPYFDNVVLLLHADGVNGSTTATDSSNSAKTMTAVGGAQLSTAQQKFGTASMLFAATGDRFSTPTHADFLFGTGDFTVEAHIRFPVLPVSDDMLLGMHRAAIDNLWLLIITTAGKFRFYNKVGLDIVGAATLLIDTWYHVAVSRSGATTRLFVNGVLDATSADATDYDAYAFDFTIGGDATGAAGPQYAGYIDEVRITKGVARYTANFTPPAAAHPDW